MRRHRYGHFYPGLNPRANCFPKGLAELLDKTEPDVGSDEAFSDLKVRDAMRVMWLDGGVQKAVARGHEFALHDNLS